MLSRYLSRGIYSHSKKQYLCPLTSQFYPNHHFLHFEPGSRSLNQTRNHKDSTFKNVQQILITRQLLSFNQTIPLSLDISMSSWSSLSSFWALNSLSKLNQKPQNHHFKECSADTYHEAFTLIQKSNTFVPWHPNFIPIITFFILSLVLVL